MRLNLETKTKEQELVKAYLEENASQILANKINNGTPFEKDGKTFINKKTLDGFMKYASSEAKFRVCRRYSRVRLGYSLFRRRQHRRHAL